MLPQLTCSIAARAWSCAVNRNSSAVDPYTYVSG